GENPGAAAPRGQPAQRRAESDQQRHGADRRAEALYHHVYDVADADAGGEAGADRDDQEREEGVQARLDDEDEQDGDRDDRDRQEQPDRPIREDEFFHGRSPSGGGGLTTSVAPSRNARDPGSGAGPASPHQVPGSGAGPTGRAGGV